MKLKDFIFLLVIIGLVIALFFSGISLESIITIVLLILIFRILRTIIYKKIEQRVRSRTDFTVIHPEWIIKSITILIAILTFVLLRWGIFSIMKMYGFDIRQFLLKSSNQLIRLTR
jgi:hypothetical protein